MSNTNDKKKTAKKTIDVEIVAGENATVTITGSQPWEKLAEYKERALDHAASHVEIDGFRKGKAPRDRVEQEVHYGDIPNN